jgi:hypothetical protein
MCRSEEFPTEAAIRRSARGLLGTVPRQEFSLAKKLGEKPDWTAILVAVTYSPSTSMRFGKDGVE